MVSWLALTACSMLHQPLIVAELEPRDVRPAVEVVLRGDGLDAPLQVTLQAEDTVEPVVLQTQSPNEVRFQVPPVPAGAWVVVVERGEERFELDLTVLPEPVEAPCARPYKANTNLSLAEEEAVIERFHPDGRREREVLPFGRIERLSIETTPACSAIYVHLKDGERILFEDGPTSLEARATTLASYFGKPLAP